MLITRFGIADDVGAVAHSVIECIRTDIAVEFIGDAFSAHIGTAVEMGAFGCGVEFVGDVIAVDVT